VDKLTALVAASLVAKRRLQTLDDALAALYGPDFGRALRLPPQWTNHQLGVWRAYQWIEQKRRETDDLDSLVRQAAKNFSIGEPSIRAALRGEHPCVTWHKRQRDNESSEINKNDSVT